MPLLETIGKYEVLEQIGEGGFAAVYKARDPIIKRLVAIKICQTSDEALRRRFFREAEIGGNLHHPNIVAVFECGVEGDSPYLVEEYLRGYDLDRAIKHREPLPLVSKLEYLMGIAKALRYSHEKGVLHRDLKPGNVRVIDERQAKLMDFGIAMLESAHSRLTDAGTILGTAGYLAPEQLLAKELDQRVDVFSYGVLAYELLTYRRAFEGDSFDEVARNVVACRPAALLDVWPECPQGLVELLDGCIRKRRGERWRSFEELLPRLNEILCAVRPERRAGTEAESGPASATAPGVSGSRWLRRLWRRISASRRV